MTASHLELRLLLRHLDALPAHLKSEQVLPLMVSDLLVIQGGNSQPSHDHLVPVLLHLRQGVVPQVEHPQVLDRRQEWSYFFELGDVVVAQVQAI